MSLPTMSQINGEFLLEFKRQTEARWGGNKGVGNIFCNRAFGKLARTLTFS
jgi:DNA-binding transcriptional regulator GbsR (MarR family)